MYRKGEDDGENDDDDDDSNGIFDGDDNEKEKRRAQGKRGGGGMKVEICLLVARLCRPGDVPVRLRGVLKGRGVLSGETDWRGRPRFVVLRSKACPDGCMVRRLASQNMSQDRRKCRFAGLRASTLTR